MTLSPASTDDSSLGDAARESSLGRGLRVLLALAGGSSRTIAEISQELGLPLSTVYRYLRELRRFRLAEEVVPGSYAAGSALLALSLSTPFREQLRLHGEPTLRRLVDRFGETATMAIRVDTSALVVAQVESPERMRMSFIPGEPRPLHAGATATVLLAFEQEDVVEQVIASPLVCFTEHTLGTPEALLERLVQIRQDGYSVSHGEVDAYATNVAVPVFSNKRLLCSLGIAGPSMRFTEQRTREIAELMLEESAQLGQLLSGRS